MNDASRNNSWFSGAWLTTDVIGIVALHFILFLVLRKNSTFSRIENNNEREDAGRQDKHKEDKIAMGSCPVENYNETFWSHTSKDKKENYCY